MGCRFRVGNALGRESVPGAVGRGLRSHPAAKPVDFTAIAFGWFACGRCFVARHRLALFRRLLAQLAAGFCLTIEGLGNGLRAAYFAEGQDLDLELTTIVLDL